MLDEPEETNLDRRKSTQQSNHVVTKSINIIATLLSPQNEVKFLVFIMPSTGEVAQQMRFLSFTSI